MKRSISILLCLVLIFSSFSFAFADEWGASQITSVVNNVSSINSTLSNIYTRVNTITNYLTDSNHSVAYWTSAIASWMQPIYTSLTSGLAANIGLDITNGLLGYPENIQGGGTTWHPYLSDVLSSVNTMVSGTVTAPSTYFDMSVDQNGNIVFNTPVNATNVYGAMLSRLYWLQWLGSMSYNNDLYYDHLSLDYATVTQNATNWGNLQTSTFTPLSATDGLYKWLSAIQTPVARLSYVLASDERIEAQELATANEQAVVDNFIDSTGDGAVPTSSFSDVSGLSSGVTSNLSTDASPAQIWDIFNSDHGSWFSQETANQLDTTTRTRGSEFETPLLDQQMEEIYKSLGGGK